MRSMKVGRRLRASFYDFPTSDRPDGVAVQCDGSNHRWCRGQIGISFSNNLLTFVLPASIAPSTAGIHELISSSNSM
jgi:hypothetical protein